MRSFLIKLDDLIAERIMTPIFTRVQKLFHVNRFQLMVLFAILVVLGFWTSYFLIGEPTKKIGGIDPVQPHQRAMDLPCSKTT